MRIIALETSGRLGSIATLEGHGVDLRLIRQTTLPSHQRTAQSLAPTLQKLLADSGWNPADVTLVAVAVGPGSFTGLRIGVTTAKTLAYAVNAQVIGVDTLTVLAHQAPSNQAPLWAIMDAQRNELFAAKFAVSANGRVAAVRKTSILSRDDWLTELRPGDRVTGPALERLAAQLPAGVVGVDAACWQPTAAAVGAVAWRDYCAGRRDDVWRLAPHYYRLSAAEEKARRADHPPAN